jgi:hypothetical protein
MDYLRRNDIRYYSADIDFIFNRYDNDKDGRIIYSEVNYFIFNFNNKKKFYDEVYPKSRNYYN